MRLRTPLLLSSVALLAGCSSGVSQDPMDNPLYAEWYHQDIVDQIVSLELAQDESLKDADAKAAADAARKASLQAGDEAENAQDDGYLGTFVEILEPVTGEALVYDGAFYTGPDFFIVPGVDLRVYLSMAVDPRDLPFPGSDDIDLGPIASPYGSQAMPAPKELPAIRSVVLYDAALKRIHAIAQLRGPVEK